MFFKFAIASQECNLGSLYGIDCLRASKGVEVPLNTIISVPRSDGKSKISIRISRSDVSRKFVNSFFLKRDEGAQRAHPFAQRGIETVLTPKALYITIHDGVTLHLRNDLPSSRFYKTFRHATIKARIVEVIGEAFVSNEPQTARKKFDDVFVLLHGPRSADKPTDILKDGNLLFVVPIDETDFPKIFNPVVSDKELSSD